LKDTELAVTFVRLDYVIYKKDVENDDERDGYEEDKRAVDE
jgi:hypothetical protein